MRPCRSRPRPQRRSASTTSERRPRNARPRVEGAYDWHVVVELRTRDGAGELARRLRQQGLSTKRRWRYVTIGAVTEERASELAERLRGELGESADVWVDADLGDVAFGPFQFIGF